MDEPPFRRQVKRLSKREPRYASLPRPIGRPTKYLPEYCDLVEQFMAMGFSLGAFAGFMGVCKNTIKNWVDENPDFLASVARAKAQRQMEWESLGLNAAEGNAGPGATGMIALGLRNAGDGDWSDTQDHRVGGLPGAPAVKTETILVSGVLAKGAETI